MVLDKTKKGLTLKRKRSMWDLRESRAVEGGEGGKQARSGCLDKYGRQPGGD